MKMKLLDRENKGGVKCADDAEGNKRQWNRELNEARGDRPRGRGGLRFVPPQLFHSSTLEKSDRTPRGYDAP